MALGERRETGRGGDERVGSEGRRGREKRQKGGKGEYMSQSQVE